MGHYELTSSLVQSVSVVSLKVYFVISISAWLLGKALLFCTFSPLLKRLTSNPLRIANEDLQDN